MSVELDPVELGFKRPFQQEVSQVLRLRNPNSDPVAFKVKTTAPKQYCVRPNSGRIEAGKEVEVQVLLQAMKEDPAPDAKCRDKFLVQSVAVTADQEFNNIASIWSHIEQTARSSIQEKKIRVVFLPADNAAVSTPASSTKNMSAPSHRSPSPEAVTPQRGSTTAPVGAVSRPESRPADSKHLGEIVDSAHNPATSGQQSVIASAASAVANAIPTSSEDLKAKLAEANAMIDRLRQDKDTQGLRQRKTDGGSKGSTDGASAGASGLSLQQAAPSGVPIQIVAGLCLLSFLLAYILF